MDKILIGAIAAGVISLAAHAAGVYTAETYTVGAGAETDFVPAESNLLRQTGAKGLFQSNSKLGSESTSTDIRKLTDGAIDDSDTYKSNCCTLGSNAVLEWTLPKDELYRLDEIRIYSLWGDVNRNDISIRSVEVADASGVWSTVPESTFCSSQNVSNSDGNTIGETPLVTTHRKVSFSSSDGYLAMGITAIRLTFGKQDHDYGGFVEIEAIGGPAIQTIGSATVHGVADYSSSDGMETYVFSHAGSIMFATAQECERTEGGDVHSFTLLPGDEYAVTLAGDDPVTLVCSPAGATSSPTPLITGFLGTVVGETASATLALALPWAGAEDASATMRLVWARRGEALETEVPLEGTFSAGATPSVQLTGLTPGYKYCAQLVATSGGKTGKSDVFTFKVSTDDLLVIYATRNTSGTSGALEGTSLGLVTNAPGGVWVCGGGWDWSQPTFSSSLSFDCGEEKACAALPLASVGDYDKPARLTITGTIKHSQGNGGLGFWRTVQPRSTWYPVETYDEEGGTNIVTQEKRIYNAKVGFCGIIFSPSAKTLQVYENGSAVGDKLAVEVTGDTEYHTLSYTVNTADGSIEYVLFNGKLVLGLSSDAFTDDATGYAGAISVAGGRTQCKNFSVTEGQDMPVDPVLTVEGKDLAVRAGETVSFSVTAINPVTAEPVEVVFEGGDAEASFADGVFSWTAGDPGTYHFTFAATIGSSTVRETGEIRVYALPPAEDATMKPIVKAEATDFTSEVRFAGSIQTNATDCTDWGLAVNRPGTVWRWDSGFDWAAPRIRNSPVRYDLAEESTTVHLTIASTNAYVKPRVLRAKARFTFTGKGCFGFWSGRIDAANGRNPTANFSGFVFNRRAKTLQAYSNGAAAGDPVRIEFADGTSACTLRFTANLKTQMATDVVFNDYPVGDFPIPGLTDESTPLFGIGSCGNLVGYGSRLQFDRLELDGQVGGMVILVK